jgi:hypothetical protein
VHWALGEQREDGGADIAAARPRAASTAAGAEAAAARELLAPATSRMTRMAV